MKTLAEIQREAPIYAAREAARVLGWFRQHRPEFYPESWLDSLLFDVAPKHDPRRLRGIDEGDGA